MKEIIALFFQKLCYFPHRFDTPVQQSNRQKDGQFSTLGFYSI